MKTILATHDFKALKQQIKEGRALNMYGLSISFNAAESMIDEIEKRRGDQDTLQNIYRDKPSSCYGCDIESENPGPYCRCPKIQRMIKRKGEV